MVAVQHTFQSSDVTSLLLGTSVPPFCIQCRNTSWFALLLSSFMFQIRAVESPELKQTILTLKHLLLATTPCFEKQLQYMPQVTVLLYLW